MIEKHHVSLKSALWEPNVLKKNENKWSLNHEE